MTGTIHVEVTDSSYCVAVNARDVSLKDKIKCLNAIAGSLEMDDTDMYMLYMMRKMHLMEEADSADES